MQLPVFTVKTAPVFLVACGCLDSAGTIDAVASAVDFAYKTRFCNNLQKRDKRDKRDKSICILVLLDFFAEFKLLSFF